MFRKKIRTSAVLAKIKSVAPHLILIPSGRETVMPPDSAVYFKLFENLFSRVHTFRGVIVTYMKILLTVLWTVFSQ